MPPETITAIDRRTFLSLGTVASLAAAAPVAMAATGGPVAIASGRDALPAGWTGPVTVLSGDYTRRLGQIREALRGAVGREVALFLDGADMALFDAAHFDQRPHLRAALHQPTGAKA